jgi:signal transduction histidine kinase
VRVRPLTRFPSIASRQSYPPTMATGLPVASRLSALRDDRRRLLIVASAGSLACIAISTAAALQAPTRPWLVALARGAIVAVPIAVGLHAWYSRSNERFGVLLAAAGGWAFLTTLAESSDELLYTVGRGAGWAMEVLLVYLFLAFPSGRLRDRHDRLLVAAMGVAVLVLFAPRLVLAERFEVPSPYTSCVHDCPANALFALEREPTVVDAVMQPLGVVAVLLVMLGVIARLQRRLAAATPLAQRLYAPVAAGAMLRAGVLAIAICSRWLEPSEPLLQTMAWALALALPLIALAFVVGELRWRLFAGPALERLAACMRTMPDAVTLKRAFAEAFEDPSVEVVFPAPGGASGWVDARGRPVSLPAADSGLCASTVSSDAKSIAAIVHDEALCDQPQLLRAGLAMAEVALANQRLATHADAAMEEVQASRARIAAGAERERRRIERDLHDGAQQRLVALRIELELAEEVVRGDPERGVHRLQELEGALDEALEELRALAHGVYPPLLADRGLTVALKAVAVRTPLPVCVESRGIGRYAPEVESAVYFCVLEALQNVLKHARGARRVWIDLDGSAPGELRLRVRDDGAGASQARLAVGAGVVNMRDRFVALGGELEVTSVPGRGTRVCGGIPAFHS